MSSTGFRRFNDGEVMSVHPRRVAACRWRPSSSAPATTAVNVAEVGDELGGGGRTGRPPIVDLAL